MTVSGRAAPSAPGLGAWVATPTWNDPPATEPATVAALGKALRLPVPVCAFLAARGCTAVDEAKDFLRPRLEHLHDPALLADGVLAASRIADAIRGGQRILVHGDYDVDGISATALLTRWLGRLGADVVPFVPHRLRDGYDFSAAGLAAAERAGADLIVTADCGSVAHDAVARGVEAGFDVIVTDHHTVGPTLPPALAVVNPQRPDCPYPDDGLCGTGVAYKLCELVAREVGADAAGTVELLDLVALATVADLVPLRGENRVLVSYGLRRFADSRIAGLGALLDVAGVEGAAVTAGKLGFVVAPRINAAGRIGEAADALQLLLTDDQAEARALAGQLDEINRERQDEDRRTLDEALMLLAETGDPARDFGVVLAAEGWHPGVIGIVASRVVERIHRPVVMVALDGERGRGSARSIPGFHLYEAIAECSEHLGRFGGHRQAAGMDVGRASLDAFRTAFNDAARRRLGAVAPAPAHRTDLEVRISDVDLELVRWLDYLQPHGIGNPSPALLSRGVTLRSPRVVGERHLKVTLVQDGASLGAIGFGLAERFALEGLEGGSFDVLYRAERNEWRGSVSAQAKLVDLRPAR